MKLFAAIVLPLGLIALAYSQPLRPIQLSPELGEALGFHVFRYETKLKEGEVLVVTQIIEETGEKTVEVETAFQGGDKAVYPLSLVDGGAYHPSLRNTYMLRSRSSPDRPLQNLWLSGTASGGNDGVVEFKFNEPLSNDVKMICRWRGRVEKFSDVVQGWPELKQPARGFGTSSQRVLRPTFDKGKPRS